MSVEIWTNRWTPTPMAAAHHVEGPEHVGRRPPRRGGCSSTGTCLWAAAWKTTSGRYRLKTSTTAERSVMSTSACSHWHGNGGRGVVQVGLVVVQEDQEVRVELGHLAADLRSDGSAGPGDQHPPALERASHRGQVDGHRLAAQQVLDPGLPGLPERGQRVGSRPPGGSPRAGPSWSAPPSRRPGGPAPRSPAAGWGWPAGPVGGCSGRRPRGCRRSSRPPAPRPWTGRGPGCRRRTRPPGPGRPRGCAASPGWRRRRRPDCRPRPPGGRPAWPPAARRTAGSGIGGHPCPWWRTCSPRR